MPSIVPFFTDDPVFGPVQSSAETTPPIVNAFGLDTVLIDGYPIDAVVSEKHTFDLDVTEYPVERGADISDHVRPKPLKISLDCYVSDTPFGVIASHQTRHNATPSNDIYARLLAMRNNPEPVTIVTSLRSYDSMVLSQLDFPRNSGEPTGLRFTCSFVKVLIVQDTRVSIAAAITPKAAKLSPVTSTITAGTPCYIRFIEATGSESQDRADTFGPTVLGNDGADYYFPSGAGTPPASGVWIDSVASADVGHQNAILASHGLPLLHEGYNAYAANPGLVSTLVDFVPQGTQTTERSEAPVSQSPGDANHDAIDQAYTPPPGVTVTPAGQALFDQASQQGGSSSSSDAGGGSSQ